MYLVVINFTRSQPFFVSFFNVSFTSTSVLESAAHKLYFFFIIFFFYLIFMYGELQFIIFTLLFLIHIRPIVYTIT